MQVKVIIQWGVAMSLVVAASLLLSSKYVKSKCSASGFDMKDELQNLILNDTFPINFTLSHQGIRYFQNRLEKASDKSEIAQLKNELAMQLLLAGNSNDCIKLLQDVFIDSTEAGALHQLTGLAYQREGENINCRLNHNYNSCIYPFADDAVYKVADPIHQAMGHYKTALSIDSADYFSRWLLNICHVTIGEYPNKVSSEYFIDFNRYDSNDTCVIFKDIAPVLGVNTFGWLGGNIIADFNNDGFEDLFSTSYNLRDNVHLFINDGKGGFRDSTYRAGLTGITGGVNCVQADYNNDGFIDIYIMRGGWLGPAGVQPNSLLRNNGNGTFDDVTASSGLLSYHPCHSASWADVNNDGWLDLFVANEKWDSTAGDHHCELFVNQSNGKFVEAAKTSGISVNTYVKGVGFGDFDNDGFPDLYISCFGHDNFLYHNNGTDERGNVTFTDIASQAGVLEPLYSFPCMIFDFDNDGYEDIFVSGYYVEDVELASEYLGLVKPHHSPKLYRNNHDLTFSDVTAESNLNRSIYAMGLNFSDIDNDGWLDFYAGTGYGDLRALWPNLMFRNDEGKKFNDVTTVTRTGHLQKGHAVSFGDVDNDGDNDLFLDTGGFVADDKFGNILFQNIGNNNGWIGLLLEGSITNRSAIGARIKITVDENGKEKSIFRTIGSGASYGANSFQITIGTGAAVVIKRLEIYWPSSKTSQQFENITYGKFYRVNETSNNLIQLYKPVITFHSGKAAKLCHER